jgi:membrane-bound lytic murein transglycosylase D
MILVVALAIPLAPLAADDQVAPAQDASQTPAAALSARAAPERSLPDLACPWGEAGAPFRGHSSDASYGIAMPWGETHFEAIRSAYLSDDGKKFLAAVMAKAKPYLPFVEERIRFFALPDELAFLPVIESEYSPRNVSRSGAAGLWQFMRNSIAGYGMRIDDWVDERRDFMKSTDGALRKLADNYGAFGDWSLALAAYNCGDGALAHALSQARKAGIASPSFWDLRRLGLLNQETADYVPKFLAVASILMYPGRNGLPQSWDDPVAWDTIAPSRPVDLKLLSEQAGLPLAVLKDANQELRYGITPPSKGYELKIPAGSADAVRAVVDDPSRKLLRYYLHTVHTGDTISGISRRYGTPVNAIVDSNPGLQPDRIRLGQVLVVPAFTDAPPPDESEGQAGAAPDFSSSYSVAKGDTLWNISLRYGVQPELLAERNGLELGSVIREGMALRVPILKATP